MAGNATPPTAASMGSIAWRGLRSWPTVISYFSSMPTSRKNSAIRKSFTNPSNEIPATTGPIRSSSGVSRK